MKSDCCNDEVELMATVTKPIDETHVERFNVFRCKKCGKECNPIQQDYEKN